MRVKTFPAKSVVSFARASYNWGWPGGSRPESRIRRGGDGRLTVVGSPVEEGNGTGRRASAGDSGAARPAVPAEPGQPAHQREPRLRHGAPGGAGQRLLPDRGALRRHHPAGWVGEGTGLRNLRADPGRAPAVHGAARRDDVLPVPQQHPGAAASAGLSQPHPLPGPSGVSTADGGEHAASLSCRAHPTPGGERRGPLRRREGGGVHLRRRGDPGHVRLPGGAGHRQRPQAPGRAAGQGRPGDLGEHYSRGRLGVRREDGRPDVGQPGGETDRQRAAQA